MWRFSVADGESTPTWGSMDRISLVLAEIISVRPMDGSFSPWLASSNAFSVSVPAKAVVSPFGSAAVPVSPPLFPQPDSAMTPATASIVSFPYIPFLIQCSSLYIVFIYSPLDFPTGRSTFCRSPKPASSAL